MIEFDEKEKILEDIFESEESKKEKKPNIFSTKPVEMMQIESVENEVNVADFEMVKEEYDFSY